MKSAYLLSTLIVACASFTVFAQSTGPLPQKPTHPDSHIGPQGAHKSPLSAALAACSSAASGSACSFTGREGQSRTGTCWSPQPSLPLACKPAGGPEHGAMGGAGGQGMKPQGPTSKK